VHARQEKTHEIACDRTDDVLLGTGRPSVRSPVAGRFLALSKRRVRSRGRFFTGRQVPPGDHRPSGQTDGRGPVPTERPAASPGVRGRTAADAGDVPVHRRPDGPGHLCERPDPDLDARGAAPSERTAARRVCPGRRRASRPPLCGPSGRGRLDPAGPADAARLGTQRKGVFVSSAEGLGGRGRGVQRQPAADERGREHDLPQVRPHGQAGWPRDVDAALGAELELCRLEPVAVRLGQLPHGVLLPGHARSADADPPPVFK
jgi:hypothetical protein